MAQNPRQAAAKSGQTEKLPKAVIDMLAERSHRIHHYLWHEVRNNWMQYTDEQKSKIKELGWEPPRPAIDKDGRPDLKNYSGEDFLYMHRQMIKMVNDMLDGNKSYPKVDGWLPLPAPGSKQYPVPPAYPIPDDETGTRRLQNVKSDSFFEKRFRFWEHMYRDPEFLRSVSLGELGARIEFTIHNQMHMRWSAKPKAFRPDPDPTDVVAIDPKWDDPSYNWLGDTYSSHVNPIFWKLHGWVDDRIDDWATANGVFGQIQWKGTWVGKMPSGMDHHSFAHMISTGIRSQGHLDEMERMVKIIGGTGIFYRFWVVDC